MDAGGFVRAVLVPHRRENAELGEGRHPPDQLQDPLILVRLQPVGGHEFGGDLRFVAAHMSSGPAGAMSRFLPSSPRGLRKVAANPARRSSEFHLTSSVLERSARPEKAF